MSIAKLMEQLSSEYPILIRRGEVLYGILPMLFTSAIVADLNYCGYEDRWCYESDARATLELSRWLGAMSLAEAEGRQPPAEPEGWTRHPASGRRRPGGDASREHVRR